MATTKKSAKKSKATRKVTKKITRVTKKSAKKAPATRDYKITVEGVQKTVSAIRDIVLEAPRVTFVIRKARTEVEARKLVLEDEARRSVLRKTGIPIDAVRKAKVELA